MTNPPPAAMDLDELIDNNARISTKANGKTFDLKNQLPAESVTLSTTPYKALEGNGPDFFRSDLTKFTRLALQIMFYGKKLSAEQVQYRNTHGLTSSEWIEVLTGAFNNADVIARALSVEETTTFKVIMSRLSYTPPNALFSVSRSSTDPTNASRAWYASHLTLGSWHAKLKQKNPSEARKLTQTTLTTDTQTGILQINNKKQRTSMVSPDPKSKSTNRATFDLTNENSKRPANGSPPRDDPSPAQPTKVKTANQYVQGEIKEARITFRLNIKTKEGSSSDEVALALIGDLLRAYQAKDPSVAILPWKRRDGDVLPPLRDPEKVPLMESSKFRSKYADRFRPKNKQNCWFSMAIAHSCVPQHLLSGDASNLASWFDDHDGGAWLSAVQGSDDTVPVGDLLYGGPFLDVVRITNQIQIICQKAYNQELKFGCRISKSAEVSVSGDKPRNWMLAENQLIKIEADRNDAKRLKPILYQFINKKTDFRKRPGQYNIRFLPDKSLTLSGTTGSSTRTNTLRKHSAVIRSLEVIKSTEVKHLDNVININGNEYTLRSIILNLSFPLCDQDENDKRTLFHSVDYPSSGPDVGNGTVLFTAYKDRADLAERLVSILPMYVREFVHTSAATSWFQPGAIQAVGGVTFGHDIDGNWDGTWTTEEDELARDILDEDMGVQFEFDFLPDVENQMVLLTAEEASVDTFGAALTERNNHESQQKESGIPAEQAAVATEGGDGAAE